MSYYLQVLSFSDKHGEGFPQDVSTATINIKKLNLQAIQQQAN